MVAEPILDPLFGHLHCHALGLYSLRREGVCWKGALIAVTLVFSLNYDLPELVANGCDLISIRDVTNLVLIKLRQSSSYKLIL